MIIVIPCGSKKRPNRSPAWNLYTGGYFRANLAWARSMTSSEEIFILSALHGLISLDDEIEPYDLLMGKPGCVRPSLVQEQAARFGLSEVIALGGSKYITTLRGAGLKVKAPFSGLPMGMQISMLNKNHGRIPG